MMDGILVVEGGEVRIEHGLVGDAFGAHVNHSGLVIRDRVYNALSRNTQGLIVNAGLTRLSTLAIEGCQFWGGPGAAGNPVDRPYKSGLILSADRHNVNTRLVVRDCLFDGWHNGVDFSQTGSWSDVLFENCVFRNAVNFGLRGYHVPRLRLRDCTFRGCVRGALVNSAGAVLEGCVFEDCETDLLLNLATGATLRDCHTTGTVWVTGSKNVVMERCTLAEKPTTQTKRPIDGYHPANLGPSSVKLRSCTVGGR